MVIKFRQNLINIGFQQTKEHNDGNLVYLYLELERLYDIACFF